ncbi:MAG: oxygen-independent coproporphyrinogen III oxidase [Myxococcota bacterium]
MSEETPIESGERIPWSLVERYDRPLPRYTSYPPVPRWSSQDDSCAHPGLEHVAATHAQISAYVHVPFCHRMCAYCGCNTTVTKRANVIERYRDTLTTEIRRVSERTGAKTLKQLHFGGGTPTMLTLDGLERVVETLFGCFPPHENAELGIEVDPTRIADRDFLRLRAMGFNRISLGIQDFDRDVQAAIGRFQWAELSLRAFELARAAGFASINVDLMYGLPLQTEQQLENNAAKIVALAADRVALFGYAHVPQMKPHQRRLESYPMPTARERWEMFCAAQEVLTGAGYRPIGFDHFALPSDELVVHADRLNRNFQGYTLLEPMPVLGFGASAISDLGDRFVQNTKRLSSYTEAIESGGLATDFGYVRSAEDEARRTLIVQLMCRLKLDFDTLPLLEQSVALQVRKTHSETLEAFASHGLIKFTDRQLRVTERGRPFLRHVASCFDEAATQLPSAPYSRAV